MSWLPKHPQKLPVVLDLLAHVPHLPSVAQQKAVTVAAVAVQESIKAHQTLAAIDSSIGGDGGGGGMTSSTCLYTTIALNRVLGQLGVPRKMCAGYLLSAPLPAHPTTATAAATKATSCSATTVTDDERKQQIKELEHEYRQRPITVVPHAWIQVEGLKLDVTTNTVLSLLEFCRLKNFNYSNAVEAAEAAALADTAAATASSSSPQEATETLTDGNAKNADDDRGMDSKWHRTAQNYGFATDMIHTVQRIMEGDVVAPPSLNVLGRDVKTWPNSRLYHYATAEEYETLAEQYDDDGDDSISMFEEGEENLYMPYEYIRYALETPDAYESGAAEPYRALMRKIAKRGVRTWEDMERKLAVWRQRQEQDQ
jgi:hypothetical protein